MHQDEELHAEMLKAFRTYFEMNQQWINEGTKASAIRLRKQLVVIRNLCIQRRAVIREWAVEKEAILRAKEDARQAQKRQAAKDDNAN